MTPATTQEQPTAAEIAPITQDEMRQLFGATMPTEAIHLLWEAPGDRMVGQLRAELRAIAKRATPPVQAPAAGGYPEELTEDQRRYLQEVAEERRRGWKSEAPAAGVGDRETAVLIVSRNGGAAPLRYDALVNDITQALADREAAAQADEREQCAKFADTWSGSRFKVFAAKLRARQP